MILPSLCCTRREEPDRPPRPRLQLHRGQVRCCQQAGQPADSRQQRRQRQGGGVPLTPLLGGYAPAGACGWRAALGEGSVACCCPASQGSLRAPPQGCPALSTSTCPVWSQTGALCACVCSCFGWRAVRLPTFSSLQPACPGHRATIIRGAAALVFSSAVRLRFIHRLPPQNPFCHARQRGLADPAAGVRCFAGEGRLELRVQARVRARATGQRVLRPLEAGIRHHPCAHACWPVVGSDLLGWAAAGAGGRHARRAACQLPNFIKFHVFASG